MTQLTEHQQQILTALKTQSEVRRQRESALRAVENTMAQTMSLAIRHKITWIQIGRQTGMSKNTAYKWWSRRRPAKETVSGSS